MFEVRYVDCGQRCCSITFKLPINIDDLLYQRTVESERIEYKEGWNPESILHTLCAFANDFHNIGGGYMLTGGAEKNDQPQKISKEHPPFGLLPEQIDAIQKELLNLGPQQLHYTTIL